MDAKRIHVLPDHLVNQIAAGEVVENPASVVKELVENAIDAKASKIIVEIEGGGLGSIRVVDDGHGMGEADAVLALKRHATSKIFDHSDLDAIGTMGFRGEALPSIASVSDFTLQTKLASADVGAVVSASGGQVDFRPATCPTGTAIIVENLFQNVPARLKFQKSERVQVSAIADVMRRSALAFEGVHFVFKSDGRVMMDVPPCANLVDRVVMVFGKDFAGCLHSFESVHDGIGVVGVVGSPDLARADPSRVVILVNRRPVVDLGIRKAATQAFSTLIPPGRFPVAVIAITCAPDEVDVNVHPRKAEVRFRRHREVIGAVFSAIAGVVADTPWIKVGAGDLSVGAPAGFFSRPDYPGDGHATGFGGEMYGSSYTGNLGVRDSQSDGDGAPFRQDDMFNAGGTPGAMAGLRYIGQVANTILVCEGDQTLVLIDQHAAHERVNFEHLWRALESGGVASEAQLFPEIVKLEQGEMARFDAASEALGRLGFDVEPFSNDSLAIRAVPAVLRGRSAKEVVRECLGASTEEATGSGTALLHKIVATVACHASVRAGDPLTPDEARALLAAMDKVATASYCPHGRQAVVVRPISSVLREFDR